MAKRRKKKYEFKERECERCQTVFKPTGGNTKRCESCRKEAKKEKDRKWAKDNPEKVKKKGERYYRENRAKVLKSSAKYYQENRDRLLEEARNKSGESLKQKREKTRKWQEENRERTRELALRWAKENPEKANEKSRLRYHRLGGRGYRKAYDSLLESQNGLCALCFVEIEGRSGQVDHKIPVVILADMGVSQEVINCRENLQVACEGCNKAKGDSVLPEYEDLLIRLVAYG